VDVTHSKYKWFICQCLYSRYTVFIYLNAKIINLRNVVNVLFKVTDNVQNSGQNSRHRPQNRGEDNKSRGEGPNTKIKVKLSRYRHASDKGERQYSSYTLTSALDGGEWSASRPGRALTPGRWPPVHIVQEAGWTPEPVCTQIEEKPFASAGDRTPVALSSSL
jgi:hypothetical protein